MDSFLSKHSLSDLGQHVDDNKPVCGASPGSSGGAAAGVEPGGRWRAHPPQNPFLSHRRSGKYSLDQ